MATWDYETGGEMSDGGCPHGEISTQTTVYEWIESSSDRVIFSSRNNFRAVPGAVLYENNECSFDADSWIHRETDRVIHGWGVSDISDPQVTSDRPSTGANGSESLSLSISTSGASINWTYTQPDWDRDVTGDSVSSEWTWSGNNYEANTQTVTWETGSECEFAEGASISQGDTLCIVGGVHTFDDYLYINNQEYQQYEYFYYG